LKKENKFAVVAAAPTTVDYALAYSKLGWAVLPVWSVDEHGQCRCGRPNTEKGHKVVKHPHTQLTPRGHLDATTEEQVIRDWWATDPGAGIGVALAASGLLALDIDPQNGGRESLAALEAEHGYCIQTAPLSRRAAGSIACSPLMKP
jgi:hypothetical protein